MAESDLLGQGPNSIAGGGHRPPPILTETRSLSERSMSARSMSAKSITAGQDPSRHSRAHQVLAPTKNLLSRLESMSSISSQSGLHQAERQSVERLPRSPRSYSSQDMELGAVGRQVIGEMELMIQQYISNLEERKRQLSEELDQQAYSLRTAPISPPRSPSFTSVNNGTIDASGMAMRTFTQQAELKISNLMQKLEEDLDEQLETEIPQRVRAAVDAAFHGRLVDLQTQVDEFMQKQSEKLESTFHDMEKRIDAMLKDKMEQHIEKQAPAMVNSAMINHRVGYNRPDRRDERTPQNRSPVRQPVSGKKK